MFLTPMSRLLKNLCYSQASIFSSCFLQSLSNEAIERTANKKNEERYNLSTTLRRKMLQVSAILVMAVLLDTIITERVKTCSAWVTDTIAISCKDGKQGTFL